MLKPKIVQFLFATGAVALGVVLGGIALFYLRIFLILRTYEEVTYEEALQAVLVGFEG